MRLSLWILMGLMVVSCASNPHKAEKVESTIDESKGQAGGGVEVGLNKSGEMVTQKKIEMADYLRRLQEEVYTLQDDVFGSESGNKGKWGVLEECRSEANSKEMGGDGKLRRMPEKEVIAPDEEEFKKMGVDENKRLVGVSEEFLKDRIDRFKGYKKTLQSRKDEFDKEIKICRALVKERQHDKKSADSSKAE